MRKLVVRKFAYCHYQNGHCCHYFFDLWRCVGLMVSALAFGLSGPGLSPGQGHCIVFLGKTLYSHSASLHLGVYG